MSSLPDAVLRLTQGERDHPLWRKLAAHMKDRLARKRADNDNPKMDKFQTAVMRGHIECLKELIELENLPPIE